MLQRKSYCNVNASNQSVVYLKLPQCCMSYRSQFKKIKNKFGTLKRNKSDSMVTRDLWAGKEDTKIEKLTLHLLRSRHTPGQHHRGSTRNYYEIRKEWNSPGHPISQVQIK